MSVVVVGAGPAGVRAVETLVASGIRPVWIEEGADGGGRVFQKPPPGFSRDARALYGADHKRAQALHAAHAGLLEKADWRPGTLVWNLRAGLLDLQRPDGGHEILSFERIILCTGAIDRVVPIPGWTQPGVTSLGAAQIALKTQGLALGNRVALCGTGPLLLLLAWQLTKAGAPPALVLESAGLRGMVQPGLAWNIPAAARGLAWMAGLRRAGVAVQHGALPLRVAEGCEALVWRDARGDTRRTAVDAVALGWGLKPETQLADLAGARFAFDRLQRLWLPERDRAGRCSVPGVYLAGDGASIGGSVVAELAGARAALALLEDAGLRPDPLEAIALDRALAREARFRRALERAFPYPHALAASMPDETLLCRCEAITAGEMRASAAAEPHQPMAPDINRGKALTRVGMGRCQGRLCGPPAAEVLAAAIGCDVSEVGRLRGQMPVKPVVLR
jgi:NADPH-dependent 2,4-dienoyl-CoA reductase/sulfur reductase-like enzyme